MAEHAAAATGGLSAARPCVGRHRWAFYDTIAYDYERNNVCR